MFHTFAVSCLCCCCLVGVCAGTDELKSVSVMEGDSVSLNSSLTQIQTGDEIFWKFGPNRSLIAITDGVRNTVYDVPDGRFRGRLKLDDKTGSLTIMNIRSDHTGVYEAEISRSSSSSKHRFNVTVSEPVDGQSTSQPVTTQLCNTSAESHAPCCDSVGAVLRLVVTALMGVAAAAAVVLLVNDIRSTRAKTEKKEEIS